MNHHDSIYLLLFYLIEYTYRFSIIRKWIDKKSLGKR